MRFGVDQNKKGKLCEINRGKSPFVYIGFREVIFLVLKTIYSYRFLSPDNGFPVLSLPYFVQTYGKIIEIGKGWTYLVSFCLLKPRVAL